MAPDLLPIEDLGDAVRRSYPELEAVREAAGEAPVYLVGGAVRDLLLGRVRADLDLVVVGDPGEIAASLDAERVEHERFATARARLDGHRVDIAGARAERYPRPGALPEVEPAGEIETDLRRRDFTINAMAVPLDGERGLIDPHDGRADLGRGVLRVLHEGSFRDDPTRALRAARYAARFGFALEPGTEALVREADLSTVSADRRDADLVRLAAEPEAVAGLALLADWGLVDLRPDGLELAARVAELLESPPWTDFAPRERSILAAALGPAGSEADIAAAEPARPSQAVELAAGRDPVELALARARGAEWLDRYLAEWRRVELEIDGGDLIAAGIPEGPALGRGLAAALRRKLDGELAGRDEELAAAVEEAGGSDGVG